MNTVGTIRDFQNTTHRSLFVLQKSSQSYIVWSYTGEYAYDFVVIVPGWALIGVDCILMLYYYP